MAGGRGYRSYRGKTSKKKIFLAVLLILVILTAMVVVLLQEHIVYDQTGAPYLEVPWHQDETKEQEESDDLDLVIRPMEEEPTQVDTIQAMMVPSGLLTQETLDTALAEMPDCNAVALVLKDTRGTVYFDAMVAEAGAKKVAEDTSAALMGLTEGGSGLYTIAQIACFHDSKAANENVESMGLENTGGYIFYDGNNSQWLDPAKAAARQYLCELAKETAEMGFREILLTGVSYPTEGKLDKIAYGETAIHENIRSFLEEMHTALEPYQVRLSIEIPVEVIAAGRSDSAGLILQEIAPLVDCIYAETPAEDIESLEALVKGASEQTDFIPKLAGNEFDLTGSFLLQVS